MANKYNDAQRDPELLSLHHEVALVDARIAELLQRVDSGESGAMWETLRKEWDEFRLVRASGDVQGMHKAMGRLDAVMARALTDHAAWEEIGTKLEQRRKLVESESKRLTAMRQTLNQEQVLLLMGALVDIVTRHVPDKRALSQIVVDLQQVVTKEALPMYAAEPPP